jgi:LmbE family N-acetylglucosaminyl deacetylase
MPDSWNFVGSEILKEKIMKLMITAHSDDEVIFAGEKLLKEKGQWEIMCMVTPDHQSKFRIPMLLEKVSSYLQVKVELMDFEDTGFNSPISGNIFIPIKDKIKSQDWTEILTHGPKGEYGHPHHIQVHNNVVASCRATGNLDKLYVFDPIKHDKIDKLTESKRKLFEATYDDETNLPDDHPRKWIHGWNTIQGWEERITKFI